MTRTLCRLGIFHQGSMTGGQGIAWVLQLFCHDSIEG